MRVVHRYNGDRIEYEHTMRRTAYSSNKIKALLTTHCLLPRRPNNLKTKKPILFFWMGLNKAPGQLEFCLTITPWNACGPTNHPTPQKA